MRNISAVEKGPHTAPTVLPTLKELWKQFLALFEKKERKYEPSKYYMRGPGPKCEEKRLALLQKK